MKLLKKVHLYCNSNHRTSGSIYNYELPVDPDLFRHKPGEYVKLRISGAVIPYTWNNIYSDVGGRSNNTFTFIADEGEQTITLSVGSYTAFELADELQTKMNAATSDTITCTWSSITNKFTFTTSSTSSPETQGIKFANDSVLSNEILGFTSASTNNFNSVSKSVSSTIPASMVSTDSVFIHSNLGTRTYLGNGTHTDILLKIPIECPPYSNIVYHDHQSDCDHIINHLMTKFTFRITDGDNNEIELLRDWTLTFTIEYYKDLTGEQEKLLKQLVDLNKLRIVGKALKKNN